MEAALCGLRIDLFPSSEQRLFWWWVCELTSARRKNGGGEQGRRWAEVWHWIALARMVVRGLAAPLIQNLPQTKHPIPLARFNLRFKWERKPCYLYSGTRPLYPRFSRWTHFDSTPLPTSDVSQLLDLASNALQQVDTSAAPTKAGAIGIVLTTSHDLKMSLARKTLHELRHHNIDQ